MQEGTRLAAVDLGSNSFRLEIGRIEHGQFIRTEYLKETVRQPGAARVDFLALALSGLGAARKACVTALAPARIAVPVMAFIVR